MAATRLALLCIAAILFIPIKADVSVDERPFDSNGPEDSSSSVHRAEVEALNSRIHFIESLLYEKTQELEGKNKVIADREKTITDKSSTIFSLQTEIITLRKKGTVDAQEKMGKANARAHELENQVDMLNRDIEQKNAKIAGLQENLNAAKDKVVQLNIKLNDLRKFNDEVNIRVRKTERALLIAEEEMKKAKFDVTSKTKELIKVRNAWIPHWLEARISLCKFFLKTEWSEHGKPVLDIVIHEILKKKASAEKWAEPHIYTLKNKYVSTLKEKWVLAVEYVEPHVKIIAGKIIDLFETYRIALKVKWVLAVEYAEPHLKIIAGKIIDLFETYRTALNPHVVKVQKITVPYIREGKRISQPVVNQVATVVKPYGNTVKVKLRPYTAKMVLIYWEICKSVEVYHNQVRVSVYDFLGKYDLTKALATDEFVWFMASALLLFPILTLLRIVYGIIRNKKKSSIRNRHNKAHGRRKKKLNMEKEKEKEKEIRSR